MLRKIFDPANVLFFVLLAVFAYGPMRFMWTLRELADSGSTFTGVWDAVASIALTLGYAYVFSFVFDAERIFRRLR